VDELPIGEVHVWLAPTATHQVVRSVLARYVGDGVEIEVAPGGKPFVVGRAVSFNLSHSGALAAVAVTAERDVGVDVQERRPVRRQDGVARRVMTAAELDRYLALPDGERLDFLLWLWARKEALVKATGQGLRRSLRDLACEPAPDDRWSVVDLDVPGYAAAVAAEGRDWRPVTRVWST
jgi:4'-phosphopantetheinyl transferase